ncbi:protein translocase subunit SecD [Sphingomonas sp. RS6]
MLDFPRWKVWSIVIGLAAMVLLAVPSLVPESVRNTWPSWVPKPAVNLGLDLAGGSYLLLEGDTSDVQQTKLEQMREQVRLAMRRDPRVAIGDISIQGGKLSFMVRDPSQVDAAREKLLPMTNGVGTTGQRDWEISVRDTSVFVLTPTQAGLAQQIETAMDDAREVVDKRINALGTREPTVIREGTNRIVVQVPGLQDPSQLKALLGKTAKLEFKLVDTSVTPQQVASGDIPVGSQLLQYENGAPIVVNRTAMITGDMLVDAKQSYDPQGRPDVTLQLDGAGAKRFARVTQENTGKPFAIIVDNKVISAPNINEPILGGSASISGGFTVESANELAIALRSGKLPINLKVIQESTVSPELGADSIRAGVTASVIAIVAVVVFMVLTYGRFGVYANIAVTLNVLIILAVMGLLSATLTLPGIAGFVLTIGTAVDANVLINERIREERRRGRTVMQSVELGYKEASRTIFEANVTHAIAGFIMLVLGSGPIRGFAVVLLIGIASSVFTAVVFTRMLVTLWLRRKRPSEIHI